MNLPGEPTGDLHSTDALDRLQRAPEIGVCKRRQLADRTTVGGEREREDRLLGGIELLHDRGVDVRRKIAADLLDLRAHVGRCSVDVGAEIELDDDDARALE